MPARTRTTLAELLVLKGRRNMSDALLDVFADGLGLSAGALTDESSPDNTEEWDSLAAMNLVTLIEDTFGIELSTRDIMKMRSIGLARQVLVAKGVPGI